MAYNTTGLDGTILAPDAEHPAGYLKNAANGTRVNDKMLADIFQLFQLLAIDAAFTFNDLPDSTTNTFQLYDLIKTITLDAPGFEFPTLINDWIDEGSGSYFPPRYAKDRRSAVCLRGAVKRNVNTDCNGVTIFTLPGGYRPVRTVVTTTMAEQGVTAAPIILVITPAGDVIPSNFSGSTILSDLSGALSFISLDNISFFTS